MTRDGLFALDATFFGPQQPMYPPLIQVVRVTSGTVAGPSLGNSSSSSSSPSTVVVYVSFTEQLAPDTLLMRDREPCLVIEPNGNTLSPGIYLARLVSNYTGLPLYAVVGAKTSSTTGSSSSSPTGGLAGGAATTTTASFVIPKTATQTSGSSSASPGGSVLVTVASTATLIPGQTIEITDGTSVVYGTVTSVVNDTQFIFSPTLILVGNAGDTMKAGALVLLCCPIFPGLPFTGGKTFQQLYIDQSGVIVQKPLMSSLTVQVFNIPTFNSSVTVFTDNTSWMVTGGEVLIISGNNYLYGYVTVIDATSFTFTTSAIIGGGPGGSVGLNAAIIPAASPIKNPTQTSFVIPALGNAVSVTVPSTVALQTNQEVAIYDGTNYAFGFITVDSSTSFTFTLTLLLNGATGNTMKKSASVTPGPSPTKIPTTTTFVLPVVGAGVTVNVATTAIYKSNDIVTISDNTNIVSGFVTIINATSFTFTPISFFQGAAGNTMSIKAVVVVCCFKLNVFTSLTSGGTVDLSTSVSDWILITGVTTINNFGNLPQGVEKTLKFQSALTLTYNATAMILPGAASIITAANDTAIFRSLGSGNWECVSYTRAGVAPYNGPDTNTVNVCVKLCDGTSGCLTVPASWFTAGPCPSTSSSSSPAPPAHAWYDTFTEAGNTAVQSHTPNIGSGGYTLISGSGTITGGVPGWSSTTGGGAFVFNPGSSLTSATMKFFYGGTGSSAIFQWRANSSLTQYWQVQITTGGMALSNDLGTVGSTIIVNPPGNNYTITVTDDGNNISVSCAGQTLNATDTYHNGNTGCGTNLTVMLDGTTGLDLTVN